jgi:hypothetical protein
VPLLLRGPDPLRVGRQSDFKRGKRCKKIAKLLLSGRSQKHVQTFSTQVVYVIAGLLVAHVVAFCVFTKSVGGLKMYVVIMPLQSVGQPASLKRRLQQQPWNAVCAVAALRSPLLLLMVTC